MTYLIAPTTFLDPTDNQPVIAGATVVAPEAAVVRLHPERFRPIERGNLGMPGGGLERVGGVTGFHRAGIRQRADGDWTEVALATRSIERSGTRGEVYLSDPWEATAAVHTAGYPHPAPAR